MKDCIVIDIGGTKTIVSHVKGDENGSAISVVLKETFPTEKNPENQIQKIISICDEKKLKSDCLSLSLPGVWDEKGVLKESFFLHDWLDYPFVESLSKQLKIDNVTFETDVNCGAIGESNANKSLNYESILYLNLGTGVGASLIKGGELYKSPTGLTLRMQKLVLPLEDELYTGVDLMSGATLASIARVSSVEELFNLCEGGDIQAIDIISKGQTQLAAWLINLYYLFAPDVIILNGGLTYNWEMFAEGAVDLAKEELEDYIDVIPSKLKEEAPLHGAFLNNIKQSVIKN